MSYISSVQPASTRRASNASHPKDARVGTLLPVEPSSESSSGRLSTGLEAVLLLTTLSGLSLVLCTIVAGAF